MGSPAAERDRNSDETQHKVTLPRGFWMADTACTQALWEAVMGTNPSRFTGERRPVENVSWEDARRFLERLNAEAEAATVGRPSARAGVVGLKPDLQPDLQPAWWFRLPTEAQWEYACRAGTTGPFSFSDGIDPELANYDGNHPYRGGKKGQFRGETVDVGSLPASPWGLYEMHGNVWEWCQDWYGNYLSGSVTDPVGPATGEGRVLRGGSWFGGARYLRSAYRHRVDPGYRSVNVGFRLALGPEPW